MVRNHQDGYPYLNLSYFFFFFLNIQKRQFYWKYWLVNEFRTAMGGGLLGISKKLFPFSKLDKKMVKKLGQFAKLKWPYSSLQFCTFFYFFFENIQNCQFFLEKLIGLWIPDRDGRGIARDIKKLVFIFKTGQKMLTKFGQFKKLKCPNFVNCPKFVTMFCRVLKMIFFNIHSYLPPIAVRN